MVCKNCGTKLDEVGKICKNCGEIIVRRAEKKGNTNDTEIYLTVRPVLNLGCIPSTGLLIFVIALFIRVVYFFFYISIWLGVATIITVITAWIIGKKKLDNVSYNFYKTKLIYKSKPFNGIEEEYKYKNITDVIVKQTIFQKIINTGEIILFLESEKHKKRITIINVKQVQDMYTYIKLILDKYREFSSCNKIKNKQSNIKVNSFEYDNHDKKLLEIKPNLQFLYNVLSYTIKKNLVIYIGLLLLLFGPCCLVADSIFVFLFIMSLYYICISIYTVIIYFYESPYNKWECVFFEDRIIFKENNKIIDEKKIEYKDIIEITKKQTTLQKIFNVGDIKIYNNANDETVEYILIKDIKNIKDVCSKIKINSNTLFI